MTNIAQTFAAVVTADAEPPLQTTTALDGVSLVGQMRAPIPPAPSA